MDVIVTSAEGGTVWQLTDLLGWAPADVTARSFAIAVFAEIF
jgi:hypothetical protein